MSSPRPWGCFSLAVWLALCRLVFPTPVGVFLASSPFISVSLCLPHARGGVSYLGRLRYTLHPSSPRPWGCFLQLGGYALHGSVFPTPVGVFRSVILGGKRALRLPHARGGVSDPPTPQRTRHPSSPRPWGCFCKTTTTSPTKKVFPTPVGVFLDGRAK